MKSTIWYQAWKTKAAKISAPLLASLLVMVLTFGGCAVAQSAPQTTEQVLTPVTNGAATAPFQISSFIIYPESGYPGQEIVIMTAVTNTSDSEVEYVAELKINNTVEEQKNVTLPAREARELNFSTFKFKPGTYNVSIGELTGQFEILDPATETGLKASSSAAADCCEPSGASTGQAASGGCCATSNPVTRSSPTQSIQVPGRSGGCCGGG